MPYTPRTKTDAEIEKGNATAEKEKLAGQRLVRIAEEKGMECHQSGASAGYPLWFVVFYMDEAQDHIIEVTYLDEEVWSAIEEACEGFDCGVCVVKNTPEELERVWAEGNERYAELGFCEFGWYWYYNVICAALTDDTEENRQAVYRELNTNSDLLRFWEKHPDDDLIEWVTPSPIHGK